MNSKVIKWIIAGTVGFVILIVTFFMLGYQKPVMTADQLPVVLISYGAMSYTDSQGVTSTINIEKAVCKKDKVNKAGVGTYECEIIYYDVNMTRINGADSNYDYDNFVEVQVNQFKSFQLLYMW